MCSTMPLDLIRRTLSIVGSVPESAPGDKRGDGRWEANTQTLAGDTRGHGPVGSARDQHDWMLASIVKSSTAAESSGSAPWPVMITSPWSTPEVSGLKAAVPLPSNS